MSEVLVGRASNTKTTAKINPTGTRMRRATRDQAPLAAGEGCDPGCETSLTWFRNRTLQQLPGCRYDFADRDFEQPWFRFAVPGVIGDTASASQHNRWRSERAVALGTGRSQNASRREIESGGQVHRSGIAADEQPS